MALRISRVVCILGRPVALGTGRWGSRKLHSASERSLWYAFLMLGILPSEYLSTPFQTVSRRSSRRESRRESGKLEQALELYGRLLLPHQLLHRHAVCPSDLRHGRHVGRPLAGLQGDQGPVVDVGKLRRLLVRKTPLFPKNPQLHRDRSRHLIAPLDQRAGAPYEPCS